MKRLPRQVFHYASNSGLIGIVRSKNIWTSDIRYLNDSRDYTFAFDIFDEVFGTSESAKTNPRSKDPFQALILDQFEMIRGLQTFVASFSERSDLLSQWRGYCAPGQGVSIGFLTGLLRRQARAQEYRLVPCIYDRSKQLRAVRALISRARAELLRSARQITELHIATEVAVALHELAARLKHPAFAEEREWRLVSRPLLSFTPGLQFREGKSYVVPYRQFQLTANETDLQITRVTIGPSPHPLLAQQSVVAFLRSERCELATVSKSDVPYRAW